MNYCRIIFIALLAFSRVTHLYAQTNFNSKLEAGSVLTSPGHVPFWMRSNQYGAIPQSGLSTYTTGSFYKDYDTSKKRRTGWALGLEARADAGKTINTKLIEGFVKLRLFMFQVKAGRSKDIMGLVVDSNLSSGAFSISGNVLGIPKLEIGVPLFSNIFGGKLLSFKGNFAYGWLGRSALNYRNSVYNGQIYYHQLSLYGRFGKPKWKIKLYGGINHEAVWGWDKKSSTYNLSEWEAFKYIVTGRVYQGSKLGNHLGSIDAGLDYKLKNFQLRAYHQFFYDAGALYHLANVRDGLSGLAIINNKAMNGAVNWNRIIFEILYTKNQAGEKWSKPTPSGDENYYNNWGTGWAYNGLGLGTPFITPAYTTRKGLPNDPADYFNNNRVLVFHSGFQGSIKSWFVTSKFSYSRNWGTYGTSTTGHSLGRNFRPPRNGIFKEAGQFSAYLFVEKRIKKGLCIGAETAFDIGGLFDHSVGVSFKLSKTFL
jgi:hypothetical protein